MQIARAPLIPLLLLALWLMLASGCGAKTSNRDLQVVDAGRAQQLMEEKGGLLGIGKERKAIWLDPRTTAAYRAEHIPGAINLPYQHINRDQELLRGYDVIVVYGDDYNDPKAQGMSKRLLEFGFGSVYTLEGGLREWKIAGNRTESGDGARLGEG